MVALDKYRLHHRAQYKRSARLTARLLERPDRLISLVLIGNNLVNVAAASLTTVLALQLFGEAGVFVAALLLTLVLLVCAEITPKTIAAVHPERIAFPASYVLTPLLKLLFPVIWLLNHLTNLMVRSFGVDPTKMKNQSLESEELRIILNDMSMPPRVRNMLLNIVNLESATVNDVMVPRQKVIAINLADDEPTLLRSLKNARHTHIPVYRGDINNIVGVLQTRHIARILTPQGVNREGLQTVLQEPYFTPESTPLRTQLVNFRQRHAQIGFVVDEYGTILGLVSIWDILTEIIGDVSSVMEPEHTMIPGANNSYIVRGPTHIREINRHLHWSLPTKGPKTLSGLIMEHLETFPDGPAAIRIDGYHIEITQFDDKRILQAQIYPPQSLGKEASPENPVAESA